MYLLRSSVSCEISIKLTTFAYYFKVITQHIIEKKKIVKAKQDNELLNVV